VDEQHPVHPTDVNGTNKHAGEEYHLLYSAVYGLPAVALRLTIRPDAGAQRDPLVT
jgi:UDP-glucose 4-epimerase